MIDLRDYQQEAIAATFQYLRDNKKGHPLIVAPTGSGKSVIIAALISKCYQRNKNFRVLVLQHRKELIQQNFEKLYKLCGSEVSLGVYSAGLDRKEAHKKCVVAGVQSIHRATHLFDKVDLIVIDECHMLPPNGDGMYQSVIQTLSNRNPALRVVGFTATPFRMKSGSLVDDDGIFTDIAFNIEVRRLIKDGYLSPVMSKTGANSPDTSQLAVKGGEFVLDDAAELYTEQISRAVYQEFLQYGKDRKSVLVFCSSVRHAEYFSKLLRQAGEKAECITGESEALFRDLHIENFKRGKIRFLVNVDVLTTGFDAPNTDCLMILRPTKSPGLYVQMIGRGMRISPTTGKTDCLVLDFGGNVERHGPIDMIQVRKKAKRNTDGTYSVRSVVVDGKDLIKTCRVCRASVPKSSLNCPECNYEFPPEIKHNQQATEAAIISDEYEVFDVQRVEFLKHEKTGKPASLKIQYFYSFNKSVSDFLCFDHSGFAHQKAREKWATLAKNPEVIPDSVDEALFYCETGDLRPVSKIKCLREGKFLRIVAWKWADPEQELVQLEASKNNGEIVDLF